MQNGPIGSKVKQGTYKPSGANSGVNTSFKGAANAGVGLPAGTKVTTAGGLNSKMVPQLYMRGYSPSKPQWKF